MLLSKYLRRSRAAIPLGALKVGSARHRALLFKLLADALGLPCQLQRDQRGGADDQAYNIVKIESDEFTVDLVTDPGHLTKCGTVRPGMSSSSPGGASTSAASTASGGRPGAAMSVGGAVQQQQLQQQQQHLQQQQQQPNRGRAMQRRWT